MQTLQQQQRKWKRLNQISDDNGKGESNNNSNDDGIDDSSGGRDNDNMNDLDWESSDDNEPDMSDPEYEVNEIAATQEGIPYELDEYGQVKLDGETTVGLRHILERARKRNALFIKHIIELGR